MLETNILFTLKNLWFSPGLTFFLVGNLEMLLIYMYPYTGRKSLKIWKSTHHVKAWKNSKNEQFVYTAKNFTRTFFWLYFIWKYILLIPCPLFKACIINIFEFVFHSSIKYFQVKKGLILLPLRPRDKLHPSYRIGDIWKILKLIVHIIFIFTSC